MDKIIKRILERAIEDFGRHNPPLTKIELEEAGYSAEVKFKDGQPVFLTMREETGTVCRTWGFGETKIQQALKQKGE